MNRLFAAKASDDRVDTPAWITSMVAHALVLVGVGLSTFVIPSPYELRLVLDPQESVTLVPDEFQYRDEVDPEIGAAGPGGTGAPAPTAPELAADLELVKPTSIEREIGEIEYTQDLQQTTVPWEAESNEVVKGVSGVGTTGASGAIDRITHEILLSLDKQDTLVVWLFDQSWSLFRQRTEIRERLAKIYQELGFATQKWEKVGDRHQPLLTSVLAFGESTRWMLDKPTADISKIQQSVADIEPDESGLENVFRAIQEGAQRYSRLRSKRNIMLIVISDEVGDDQESSEAALEVCQRFTIPVYVIGVPAAFGQAETLLKWVDPRPNHDPAPQLGRVNQGPESFLPERLLLPFGGTNEEAIDSGFGPYSLTRLCYQTEGIYFAVHPNRKTGERVGLRETSEFSAHLSQFFDPQRMRPYRPEYGTPREYQQQVQEFPHRAAVVKAATLTVNRMQNPQLRFVKREEAQFSNELTEAQKVAAKLEPKLNMLHDWLKQGESTRSSEVSLRWQAAYDLAMGQCLAVLVRTRTYNEMLAKAKRGLKPSEERNNTWELSPDAEISVGSRHERDAEKAKTYLQRVIDEHTGTPWEYLARQELNAPFGWKWRESYTPPPAPQPDAPPGNNNPPPPPRDDQRQMIGDQPMVRNLPKL